MTAVAGTVFQVHGHTTPNGFAKDSSNRQVLACFVSLSNIAGTYAAGDGCTLTALGAAIAASRRDGKTVTLMQVAMAAPGKMQAGTIIGAKTGVSGIPTGVSSDNAQFLLTQADLSTEFGNGAIAETPLLEPISLFVLYKQTG